jgi:ATP-dependent Lhr-like helicase
MSTNAYERLAPFIKDYIYKNKWTELRDVQVAACNVIFDTDCNLLLSSGTASGKTEAAFLPILTHLYDNPSSSVGVLYISPLKALINDQFYRLDDLLKEADIPVHKWHGDVSQNNKSKLLRNPQGILQTTPESLEGMLMNRKSTIIQLFNDLKYVVIDEVHNFMSSDRGVQLLCILERIQRLAEVLPRRIGLSATLGNYLYAEMWLNSGAGRMCITPKVGGQKQSIRLAVEHFWNMADKKKINSEEDELNLDRDVTDDKFTNFLYTSTLGKKCILFSNTKSDVEMNIANLKQLAEKKHTPDNFLVHHGSLSATLREFAEHQMKNSEKPIVIGATTTLELGIDVGALERIVQCGSPHSVSSFVQRLGRTGRRGTSSEMWFAFLEEEHLPSEEFYRLINWSFIRCIAIIQLYLEERWIEPIELLKYPYGIVYHQTMSTIASLGEVTPAQLAQNILSLSAFAYVSQEDYKLLLKHLIDIDHLQRTERGGVIVGIAGEREINNYRFYAVFATSDDYSVKCGSEDIGSVDVIIPIGEMFLLAGKTWEVVDTDKIRKIIYVKHVKGKSKINWSGGGGTIHTKVLNKMKEIISEDKVYTYLNPKAVKRIKEIRKIAQNTKINTETVLSLGGNKFIIFPWLGSRALYTLKLNLSHKGFDTEPYQSVCLLLNTKQSLEEILKVLNEIKNEPLDKYSLVLKNVVAIPSKFIDFLPPQLLNKQFVEDFIDMKDMCENLDL